MVWIIRRDWRRGAGILGGLFRIRGSEWLRDRIIRIEFWFERVRREGWNIWWIRK